jgi:formylglycine-generating enzyme required for sulfatase activity
MPNNHARFINRKLALKGATNIVLLAFFFGNVFFSTDAQMRAISGGTFIMGMSGGKTNETPEHQVELSSFSIDALEVTRAQYDSCVNSGVCTPAHDSDGQCIAWNGRNFIRARIVKQDKDAELPVVCVTWYQARDYCSYKGKKLPSEAQWEYAALAGRKATFTWGDERPDATRCAQGKPKKTGSFTANPWGLFDMTGNVWEWVSDRYQSDYYLTSESKDPEGPDAGQYRAIRGGGWYSAAEQLRIKNRHWFEPNFGEVSIGFRCAK